MDELLSTIVDALCAQVPAREAQALRDALAKWRGPTPTVSTEASPAPQDAPAGATAPVPPSAGGTPPPPSVTPAYLTPSGAVQ